MTRLPHTDGGTFITDGGMETTLIFRDGLELPEFASFVLLDDPAGTEALLSYYEPYLEIARERGVAILLDAPTWRASRDWGRRLGYSPEALADVNRRAVALLESLRESTGGEPEIVISGCIGPRGDAYRADATMTAEEAERYHSEQAETLAGTSADLVSALTLTYANEAVGIARAVGRTGLPVAISFTVETDGRLPSGQTLGEAIEQVDAETGRAVAYFMVNCAHPSHLSPALEAAPWVDRVRGLRANASTKSHAELDEAEELDEGDPAELASAYRELRTRLPNLNVVGGCCGTDHRHVDAISAVFTR
ncbi:MAG TPA: homocysteine S-methyltransferase family protein [Gaiellaceae bacterium]|nr:homocysteine S-methyltransferase family protein [Gaiellaceae bacterium]